MISCLLVELSDHRRRLLNFFQLCRMRVWNSTDQISVLCLLQPPRCSAIAARVRSRDVAKS